MSTTGHKTWPKLTSLDEFRFLTDLVLKHSTGDYTLVSLHDQQSGTTRFANNQIVQNVDTRLGSLSVTVAFERHHGTAGTTDFTAGAVQETVTRAAQIARLSPDDPEYLPPVEPQTYLTLPTTRVETAAAGPARRLEYT
ncbi:MAG TPA: DNA gyrase modulator, partial [Nitrospiraceae bacterium]|nr:DNA gyrase modulator [Nitrospiraceae bacterium]